VHELTGFANLDSLPQLNHSTAGVRDFIYRRSNSVVRHWTERGADGWRLDAAQEIDHSWWQDFRTVVKGYAPNAPLAYYTKLAQTRRDFPALQHGGFTTLLTCDTTASASDNDVYAFLRSAGAEQPVVVVLNKGANVESASIPLQGAYPDGRLLEDAIKGSMFSVSAGSASVLVPPRSGLVLVG